MLNLILAVDRNYAIGNKNNLLYSFKRDLDRFKELTLNTKIVMGYNTWKSLPFKLKDREHVVITKTHLDESGPDVIIDNIDEVLKLSDTEDIWIIGGAKIYEQFIPYADNIELTFIEATVDEYDVDMPYMEKILGGFELYKTEPHLEKDRISGEMIKIEFRTYRKK